APYGYHLLDIPVAGRSPARPILPIRLTSSAPRSIPSDPGEHGPRRIAGVTVAPIEPVRRGLQPGGGGGGFFFPPGLSRGLPVAHARPRTCRYSAGGRPYIPGAAARRRASGHGRAPRNGRPSC